MSFRRLIAPVTAVVGLLVLAVPANGWVDTPLAPYIVVFDDAAVSGPAQPSAPGQAAHQPPIDPGRVNTLVSALSHSVSIRPVNVFSHVLGGFSAQLTPNQVRVLQANPEVDSVTPDADVSLADDPGYGYATENIVSLAAPTLPAGIKRIGATQNAIAGINDDGGKVDADVAIIDTGIQPDHPDLNVVGGYNCTTSNHSAWADDNGHGTHVAGTIGALDDGQGVVGVAPGVRLWAVKVLDASGSGLVSWIVCGIDWITAQRDGKDGSRPMIEVANMSLRSYLNKGDDGNCGRTLKDAMHQAVCRSVAAGTVYVVAAGNDRDNAANYRPAAYDEAITVSAMTDYDGKPGGDGSRPAGCAAGYPDDTWAGFSNYGPDVDLTAPGVCVLSTWAGSQYAYASGTSMAAPHVTGAAALYLAQYPDARPQQVRMALQYAGNLDWRKGTDPDGQPDILVWAGSFSPPPDFAVSASGPGGYAGVGSTVDVSVSLDRSHGHTAPVTLSINDLPAGLSSSQMTTSGNSATVEVAVGALAVSGRYDVTVSATDGELAHTTSVTLRVDAAAPTADFNQPTGDEMQAGQYQQVAWTEADSGGSEVAGRVLQRQAATPTVPGDCSNLDFYDVGSARTTYGTYNDKLYDGNCYRWSVTVRDGAGNRTTVISPTVLVDMSAPSKPSATVVGSSSSVASGGQVDLPSAWVDDAGTLWLRGGGSGSVDLAVQAADDQSGVASISLTPTTATTGWTFPRSVSGDSATAHLSYGSKAVALGLSLTATNGAGTTGASSGFKTVPDGTAPTAASWAAPASGFWYSPDGVVGLSWNGATDSGSGLADTFWVRRQRAPATSSGCGSFSKDGAPRLLPSGYRESGLLSGYCYRWKLRSVDQVGNLGPKVTSGIVLVDTVAPKVVFDKPADGQLIVKTKTQQKVSWSASDSGGSHLASVTIERQRATSHDSGSCDNATWKSDGSLATAVSPLVDTGLQSGSCYRWLVTAADRATNVTTATSGSVLISGGSSSDSGATAPSVTDLSVVPSPDKRLTAKGMVRVDASWSADGGSGKLTGYELRLSSSGGSSWDTFTTPNGTDPSMTLKLPAGRTYMVEVRAHNDLADWSDWSAPATFTLNLAQAEGTDFEKVGSWKDASLSGASGGAVTYSTSAGDIIRYYFSGSSVALVSTLGPDRGVADVYIDRHYVGTIDLYASSLVTRKVVFTYSWAKSGDHVISLQLQSTAGRPRFDVDACVVLD